jgi:hypothetical protein
MPLSAYALLVARSSSRPTSPPPPAPPNGPMATNSKIPVLSAECC